ncbi:MAG: flagellar hook capping protein, partial [Oscillospiraceae bacterium]|nr:flagellar hook capping protein [Oscillospiraceae bacterium]
MAINNMDILTGADQVKANHEKYKEKFKDANADLVNSETFLNLLVAEMTNQDPLEPTSNTEFITQMAQFSQLQYLQDTSSYSMGNYASSLVGKTVTVSEMIGGEKVDRTGVVSEVRKAGDEFQIVVDGIGFKLKSVQAIADNSSAVS